MTQKDCWLDVDQRRHSYIRLFLVESMLKCEQNMHLHELSNGHKCVLNNYSSIMRHIRDFA